MNPACHPSRSHKAKGLCAPCYRRERLRTPEGKAQRRGYYLRNSGRIIAKTRAYYRAHRVVQIAKAIIRNRRNRENLSGGVEKSNARMEARHVGTPTMDDSAKVEPQNGGSSAPPAQKFWWKLPAVPRWWEEIAA